MNNAMKMTGFRLPAELIKALKRQALKENVAEAVIVRRALGKELGVNPPKRW